MEVIQDLRGSFGPVRDQGERPTCLAFATSDAHAALRPPWIPLSCEYAFYHAQRRAGRPPSTGATLAYMLEALHEDGQPHENAWPYLAALPSSLDDYGPPDVVTVFRRNGERISAAVDEIIALLDGGLPPVLLMMLSDAFFSPDADGIVRAPNTELPDPRRRHAVVAVGHCKSEDERLILVRNSWGLDWGHDGHAWVSEAYLAPRLTRVAILKEDINVLGTNLAA